MVWLLAIPFPDILFSMPQYRLVVVGTTVDAAASGGASLRFESDDEDAARSLLRLRVMVLRLSRFRRGRGGA